MSGSADFELENNRWLRIDRLAARGLGIALDGLIHADLAVPVATGTVHATSRPPETEIRFGQTALRGPVRVDIRLTPEHGRQTIGVNLSGGPLSLCCGLPLKSSSSRPLLPLAPPPCSGVRPDARLSAFSTTRQVSILLQKTMTRSAGCVGEQSDLRYHFASF